MIIVEAQSELLQKLSEQANENELMESTGIEDDVITTSDDAVDNVNDANSKAEQLATQTTTQSEEIIDQPTDDNQHEVPVERVVTPAESEQTDTEEEIVVDGE